jgi:hypothetical protein
MALETAVTASRAFNYFRRLMIATTRVRRESSVPMICNISGTDITGPTSLRD